MVPFVIKYILKREERIMFNHLHQIETEIKPFSTYFRTGLLEDKASIGGVSQGIVKKKSSNNRPKNMLALPN